MTEVLLEHPQRAVGGAKAALRAQARALFHPVEAPPSPFEAGTVDTCSTIEMNAFLDALARAPLDSAERRDILSVRQDNFQHDRTSTDGHFLLKWDSTGPLAVTDQIVDDAEADLMAANATYTTDFGQSPSSAVVEVLFNNARTPNTQLPAGPISLPASYMTKYANNRLTRQLTAIHELFHVLQGGFGFGNRGYTNWFLEGGATWAEAAYYNAITGSLKLSSLFDNPLQKLTRTVYTSLPFLIFLENMFDATKTGRYFMVDWMQFVPNRLPDANPLEELNRLAPTQRADFDADRLLVQFALQMALKTWYHTPGGTQAIPQFRDALEAGDPQIPYANQTVRVPTGNSVGFSASDDPAISLGARLGLSEFYFLQVGASSATTPYNVFGEFSANQRNNPYVGAAILNPHTGVPVSGHSQVAEDTRLGAREFIFVSDSEQALFVTAGSHASSRTNFALLFGPHP